MNSTGALRTYAEQASGGPSHNPLVQQQIRPPGGEPVVSFQRVTRQFGSRIALLDVTLELQPGVVGLLGPNGAGKTTLLNLAAGLSAPTSGTVRWMGDLPRRHPSLDNRIALSTDGDQLPRRESPLQWITGMLQLSGSTRLVAEQRAGQMLDRLGLNAKRDESLEKLSRGQRQRVKLAQAFALPASLLLLDEPLNALDPVWRREVAALLHEAALAGSCVVVSSHILEEVEALASWLVLLFKGRLVAAGQQQDIRDLLHNQSAVLKVHCQDPRLMARELLARAPITRITIEPDALVLQASDVDALCRALPQAVVATGLEVREVTTQGDDLVSLFAALAQEVR